MLLWWLLPTCINRLFDRLFNFSFTSFRLRRRFIRLLIVAIARISARRASKSTRTTSAVVPIATAALRSVAVLIAIVVEIRLAVVVEVRSTAWLKITLLIIIPLIKVVEATIVISKNSKKK